MSFVEVRQIGHVAARPTVVALSLNGRPQTKASSPLSPTRAGGIEKGRPGRRRPPLPGRCGVTPQ